MNINLLINFTHATLGFIVAGEINFSLVKKLSQLADRFFFHQFNNFKLMRNADGSIHLQRIPHSYYSYANVFQWIEKLTLPAVALIISWKFIEICCNDPPFVRTSFLIGSCVGSLLAASSNRPDHYTVSKEEAKKRWNIDESTPLPRRLVLRKPNPEKIS